MSTKRLAELLLQNWLSEVPAFFRELVDTGERYQGHPVFSLEARFPNEVVTVRVYRYTPLNSEFSKLAFVPESHP